MKKRLAKATGVVLAAGIMVLSQSGAFATTVMAEDTTEAAGGYTGDPITINFWHTRGSGSNYEVIQHEVETFNETIGKEKGITVEETYIGDYNQMLSQTQLAI